MKNLLSIFIVMMFIILTSATTATIMQIQPVIPKQTIVLKVSSDNLIETVKPYINKGYIIKSVAGGGASGSAYVQWVVVVFEKY